MIRPSNFVPKNQFHRELMTMVRDMAQASGGPLGGFCCLHPAIITKAGEGNHVWSACSARVSELLHQFPPSKEAQS